MAADFKQVVVEFDDGFRVTRVVVEPKQGVKAIFFNGAEKEFVKDKQPTVLTKKDPPRPGLKPAFNSAAVSDNGLSPVCYLVNNDLVCW